MTRCFCRNLAPVNPPVGPEVDPLLSMARKMYPLLGQSQDPGFGIHADKESYR